MKKPTVSFYTLGCRLNQSETAVLTNSLEQAGYRVLPFGEPTDIVVVNTCTVTKNSENDARRLVHRIVRQNPHAEIALVGCQSQLHQKELAAWPNVRWVIGTAKKMDIVSIFAKKPVASVQILTPAIPRKFFNPPVAGLDREHVRANIKIQDGCDEFCSFCEVPYARGRARSRDFQDILDEAQALINAGHQELVVTGINVGKYSSEGKKLEDVITALLSVAGLARLRISSFEPTAISDGILKTMKQNRRFCRHLHVPLQSGSAEILEKMRRPYSPKIFAEFIRHAAQIVPDICLGTDVIVGFPGETERHFVETFSLLEQLPVHYFHVFSYSDRLMAKSRLLANKVPSPDVQRRSKILRALGEKKRRAFYDSMQGRTVDVLFEQKKEEFWTGLTDNFLHVRLRSGKNLRNKILAVRLDKVFGQEILASLSKGDGRF